MSLIFHMRCLSVMAILLFSGGNARAVENNVAGVPAEKLNKLNVQFRSNYASAKQEIRKTLGPVIFVVNDQMTLLYKGARKSEPYIHNRFTYLKNLDHVPLSCYVLLINKVDRTLKDDELEQVASLADSIASTQGALEATVGGMPDDRDQDSKRQIRILQSSQEFLKKVQKNKTCTHAELQKFTRSIAADALANIDDAISLQLERMQTITDKWRSEIPEADWAQLHVVLPSGHMPRDQLSTFQFFCSYLNEKSEGHKIIVMEGKDTEEEGLDLLATHILDEKIAIDFFKDDTIMHRDLLSSGAHRWLRKHKLGR